MKLLAIDTSTQVMGVAILDMEERRIIGEVTTNIPQNHSTSLMPTIAGLFQLVGGVLDEITAIVVSAGPGSYTGIRIGVTTAKTLGWARELPLYSASSLAVLAMNGLRWNGIIVPLFDARRQRVYSGVYQAEDGRLLEILGDRIVAIDEWLLDIQELGLPTLFLGDVHGFQQTIEKVMGKQAHFGTVTENIPRASYLAMLGWRKWTNKLPCEDHLFTPNYCQVTEAEAKLLQKNEDEPS